MTTIAIIKARIAKATPVTTAYEEIFDALEEENWDGKNDYSIFQMHAIAVERSGLTAEQAIADNARANDLIDDWFPTTDQRNSVYQWAVNNRDYFEVIVNRFN